jgi:hypothetical protein
MTRIWTCQRVQAGEKCGTKNPRIKKNCTACGKPRPATKRPGHLAALDLTYEQYVDLNGGDHCAICHKTRQPGDRRFDRDHDHKNGGRPRGLLCHLCNRALPSWVTVEWLLAAAAYLNRDTPTPGVSAVTPLVTRDAA